MQISVKKNIRLEGKHQKPILVDIYVQNSEAKKRIVIFAHGYKGFKDWGCWYLAAEAFSKAGFCFIKFNFSHNGGTVEQPIDFPDLEAFGQNNFTKELDDLETVIDWVSSQGFDAAAQVDTKNIILIGHSRGGGIVTIKANEDDRITSVISWAGVSDLSRMLGKPEAFTQWKLDGVRYIVNGRTKQQMPHYYQFYEDYEANKTRLSVENAAKQLKIPHGIIHGNTDESVPFSQGEDLHRWNPNSIFYAIVGANHVFGGKHPWDTKQMPTHLTEVVQKTIAFIN